MMFLSVGLLLLGFGAGVECLRKGQRRLGWTLIVVGVVATLLTFFAAGLLYAAVPFAVVAVVLAARVAPCETATVEEQHVPTAFRAQSALVGAAIGVLPGVLVVAVPMVLHSLGVITSDQSQIAFIGPLLGFIGLVVGAGIGATRSRPTDSASRSDNVPIG